MEQSIYKKEQGIKEYIKIKQYDMERRILQTKEDIKPSYIKIDKNHIEIKI